MKPRSARNRICLILAILWMAVIFIFSHRPADLSEQDSSLVGEIILHIAVPDFEDLSPAVQNEMLERITYPVRKCAHMTEYALLAVLLLGAFYTPVVTSFAVAFANALILTMIYAATDEFHQTFIAGRSGELRDILIDTCGAIIGLLIARIIFAIHTSRTHS